MVGMSFCNEFVAHDLALNAASHADFLGLLTFSMSKLDACV